jgi:hypothetical protein
MSQHVQQSETATMTELAAWYYLARCESCGVPYLYDRRWGDIMRAQPAGATVKWDCQCGRVAHVSPSQLEKWRLVPNVEE